MIKRILTSIIIVLGLVACCNTAPKSTSTVKTPDVKEYAVVISFGSIGTGVPDAKPLETYISKFKRDNKIKIISADRIGPFGREGEYKLCFRLSEFSTSQKTEFINSLKNVVATLNDKGYATLGLEEEINLDTLGNRVTKEVVKY